MWPGTGFFRRVAMAGCETARYEDPRAGSGAPDDRRHVTRGRTTTTLLLADRAERRGVGARWVLPHTQTGCARSGVQQRSNVQSAAQTNEPNAPLPRASSPLFTIDHFTPSADCLLPAQQGKVEKSLLRYCALRNAESDGLSGGDVWRPPFPPLPGIARGGPQTVGTGSSNPG